MNRLVERRRVRDTPKKNRNKMNDRVIFDLVGKGCFKNIVLVYMGIH